MTKGLTAAVLATSLAMTSITATPSQAGANNFEKFLLGATALVIIGSVISNNNKSSGHGVVTHNYVPVHPVKPHRYKHLPGACLKVRNTNRGKLRFFTDYCLRNNMHNAGYLPSSCRTKIRFKKGTRTGYVLGCLKQYGWTVH